MSWGVRDSIAHYYGLPVVCGDCGSVMKATYFNLEDPLIGCPTCRVNYAITEPALEKRLTRLEDPPRWSFQAMRRANNG